MISGIQDNEVYITKVPPVTPIGKMRANNDKPVSCWIDEDGVGFMPIYIKAGRRKHIYES